MEKIIRAVKETQRKRAENSTEQVIPSGILNKPEHDNSNSEERIIYDKTRVVTLNNELLAKNRIVSFNKNNYLSTGFDILRTQVIDKMMKNGWRTMAITSPVPACGKTMVSINLSASIAHHTNRTAMLVDFDLRRPSVAKYLGLSSSNPSLNEVLAGDADISDALINPGLDRLVILPTSMPIKNSSEVLSSRKVSNLINEFRERYSERIVLFDLPPLLGTDDAMIMLSQVDCVLVVVGNGMVSKNDLEESMRYVDSEKLLGSVLNKSNMSSNKSGYYGY